MTNNVLVEVLLYATRQIWIHACDNYKNAPEMLEYELDIWIDYLKKLYNNEIPGEIDVLIIEFRKQIENIKAHRYLFDTKNGFLNA